MTIRIQFFSYLHIIALSYRPFPKMCGQFSGCGD